MMETISQSISEVVKTDNTIHAIMEFKATDPIFAGHFPNNAIIPAVYQIGVCRNIVERFFGGKFSCLQRSRFSAVCRPEIRYAVSVTVTAQDNKTLATCSIKLEAAMQSKIVLVYE